jgi:catechol 2,3-dioxygenase-like lactoylglutathione lyase family enzyme
MTWTGVKWIRFLAVLAGLAGLPVAAVAETAPTAEALQISGPVLIVSDLERSLKFYTQGLGMIVASRLAGNPGPGAVVVGPGRRPPPFILLRQRTPEAATSPPIEIGNGLSRIMLNVPDAAAAAAKLRAAGFDVPAPNGRGIFAVTDPDGYRYEVIQASPRH